LATAETATLDGRVACPSTLVTREDELQSGRRIFRQFLRISDDFGMMRTDQPVLQFELDNFPLLPSDLIGILRPPLGNTAEANRCTGIEQEPLIGSTGKLLAPGATLDAEESDSGGEVFKIAL
jgi:hypothetical protein